ncbi:DUF222 domain-containing protein [Actinomyces bowdenii]|uniref:HNH endonuclease signature motif containing protein n=1 Tax=Actinomyces bowdenii TaxID=131109 RepID=UPI00214C1B79|nr:HNH endonuclease [Actinomyces bowdenii]MCR2051867.1 DUF222 domain-containing protein [Actinomyces bowdenii]
MPLRAALLPAHWGEPEEACERIAAMAPGGALAAVIEALLSPLLVPAVTSAEPADPHTPEDSADSVGSAGSRNGGVVDPATGLLSGIGAASSEDLTAGLAVSPEAGIAQQAAGLAVLPSDMIQGSGLLALGADGLSELVAACHRLGSWATWAESMAAACLAQSPEFRTGPAPWGPQGAAPRFVTPEENRFTTSSEIACRLGISRTRAGQILERGEALMTPELGPTEALHRSGLLDGAKAALVVGRLDGAASHTALAVQEEVLPRAPRRTHAQLARDLDRALVAHDPEGASQRRQRHVRGRHVSRPRPAGEGVWRMSLLMPTMDAFLLDATLDAIAASARATGDDRTPAQLRADALTAMTLATLRTSQNAACAPGGPEPQARPPRPEKATQPEKAAQPRKAEPPGLPEQPEQPEPLGRSDPPGGAPPPGRAARPQVLAHSGKPEQPESPEPTGAPEGLGMAADAPRDGAARPVPGGDGYPMPDGVPLEGLLVSLSGLMSSTSPWWMPSGEPALHLPPGLQVRVDVTVPLDHLLPEADTDPGTHPGTAADAEADTSRRAPAGTAATAAAPTAGPVAEVVIGSRRSPVPARVARALAAGGTWRRLVTDPLTGAVLDAGRRRYRPAQDLAERVRLRDQSCTHPGCEVPARRCDLDHITPWSAGGVTSMDNLTVLCEAHHRLKHTPGWSLTRTPEGALTWRTPTGARYRRQADGTIHLLPRRLGPHSHQHQGAAVPAMLSQEITAPLLERLEQGLASTHPAQTPTAPAGRIMSSSTAGHGTGPRSSTPEGEPPAGLTTMRALAAAGAALETRGPGPGQRAGAFEATDYPRAAHLLGLAPLLDAVPPF